MIVIAVTTEISQVREVNVRVPALMSLARLKSCREHYYTRTCGGNEISPSLPAKAAKSPIEIRSQHTSAHTLHGDLRHARAVMHRRMSG